MGPRGLLRGVGCFQLGCLLPRLGGPASPPQGTPAPAVPLHPPETVRTEVPGPRSLPSSLSLQREDRSHQRRDPPISM